MSERLCQGVEESKKAGDRQADISIWFKSCTSYDKKFAGHKWYGKS